MERFNAQDSFGDQALDAIMAHDGYMVLVNNYTPGFEHKWEIPEGYKTYTLVYPNLDTPISHILVIDPKRVDHVRFGISREMRKLLPEVKAEFSNAGFNISIDQYPTSPDLPKFHLIFLRKRSELVS